MWPEICGGFFFFFFNLSCLMSNLSQTCTYIHKSILLPLKQILSMNINWNICQAFYVSGSYLTIVLVQEAHFPLTFCFIFLVRDFNKDRKMGQYLPNIFLVACFAFTWDFLIQIEIHSLLIDNHDAWHREIQELFHTQKLCF